MIKNIECFYKEKRRFKSNSQLEVKFLEYNDTFNVCLLSYRDGLPDCEVGHFGYNRYFRTAYGLKYKKYANIKSLKNSIKIVSKNNGLTFDKLQLKIQYNGNEKIIIL